MTLPPGEALSREFRVAVAVDIYYFGGKPP
jgi:hypothetical protein